MLIVLHNDKFLVIRAHTSFPGEGYVAGVCDTHDEALAKRAILTEAYSPKARKAANLKRARAVKNSFLALLD